MHVVDLLVTLFSAFLLLPVFCFVWRSVRSFRSFGLLFDDRVLCCDDISFVGCSAICCGEYDLQRLRQLLAVEYNRYELIAVVDSASHPDAVGQIISYFQLLRVNPTVDAVGGESVRALYRSRPHHFHRLVLIDICSADIYRHLNAALAVASYDYLLPLRSDVMLSPHAVETLMVCVAESDEGVDLLDVASCPSAWLFSRYVVLQAGGFSEDILANELFRHRSTLYAPVIYHFHPSADVHLRLAMLLSALFFSLIYLAYGGLWAIVVALSLASLYAVAAYQRALVCPTNSLKVTLLCYFHHITSFFYLQKFRL